MTGVQTCALPILVGAGVVPGAEHGLDGLHQLHLGIGGEVLALLLLVIGLEAGGHLLHVVGVEFGVQLNAFFQIGRASCRERV